MENTESTSSRVRDSSTHLTDSMVTVSLSDVQSNCEQSRPDWPLLDMPSTPMDPVSPSESPCELGYPTITTTPTADVGKPDLEPEKYRGAGSSIRSQSSDGSERMQDAAVWEELDKTEEQEPRGQGSDEVCVCVSSVCQRENKNRGGEERKETNLIWSSLPPSSWLVWKKRTMLWLRTPNQACPALCALRNRPVPNPCIISNN